MQFYRMKAQRFRGQELALGPAAWGEPHSLIPSLQLAGVRFSCIGSLD